MISREDVCVPGGPFVFRNADYLGLGTLGSFDLGTTRVVLCSYHEFMSGHGVEVGQFKPGPARYTGPPMDLANMRNDGVRCC